MMTEADDGLGPEEAFQNIGWPCGGRKVTKGKNSLLVIYKYKL